jgi:hypothetical protein
MFASPRYLHPTLSFRQHKQQTEEASGWSEDKIKFHGLEEQTKDNGSWGQTGEQRNW